MTEEEGGVTAAGAHALDVESIIKRLLVSTMIAEWAAGTLIDRLRGMDIGHQSNFMT